MGEDPLLFIDAEVGEHDVLYPVAPEAAQAGPAAGPLQEGLQLHASQRRGSHHLQCALERHVRKAGDLQEAAVNERQPGYLVRLVSRVLKGDVGTPGVPDEAGTLKAQRLEERTQIAGDGGEVVAVVGLVAEAVASLVQRQNSKLLRQQGRRQIPDAAVGGQAVEKDEGPPGTAPVAVVKAEAVRVDELVFGRGHD